MFAETPAFDPHPVYRGGHVQTVMGALLPSGVPLTSARSDLHRVVIPLGGGDQLEGWHAPSQNGRTVLLAHGLGGSVDSPYLAQAVDTLVRCGCGVLAINQRGSGGPHERTTRPYMTGHTGDLIAAIRWLRREAPGAQLLAVGFSISGNTLLKLLGERCHWAPCDMPDAAMAVAPPIDLDACSMDLLRPRSRAFDLWILRSCRRWIPTLRGDYRGGVRVEPWASLRVFDERYITPVWGFGSLSEYYLSASAVHGVAAIETPTLVLHATDDPVVDARHSRQAPWGPGVRVDLVHGGGHLGFLGRDRKGRRSPWLAQAVAHHALTFDVTGGRYPEGTQPENVPFEPAETPCAAP